MRSREPYRTFVGLSYAKIPTFGWTIGSGEGNPKILWFGYVGLVYEVPSHA
jgi:hypothetical protein